MAKHTRRQHTVPQVYLKGFASSQGRSFQVAGYDRVEQIEKQLSVKDAAVVSDIYDLPVDGDDADRDFLEKLLATKEGEISGPLRRLRSNERLSSEDQYLLAEFMAIQLTRTVRLRDEINELGDWYSKVSLEGMSRDDVAQRLKAQGKDPTETEIESILRFLRNPDKFKLRPPKGTFPAMFLQALQGILPYVVLGRKAVRVASDRPFITSDHPVILIGHTFNGGLGVMSAEEIWLPIDRHSALVLVKDMTINGTVSISERHSRAVSQRIALESRRWLFWHPEDPGLDGVNVPRPKPPLKIRTIGWRKRDDGNIGELVNTKPYRPKVSGERLLTGKPIVHHAGRLSPEWSTRRPRMLNVGTGYLS